MFNLKTYKRFIVIAYFPHEDDDIRGDFDTLDEAKECIKNESEGYVGHEVFDCDERKIVYF